MVAHARSISDKVLTLVNNNGLINVWNFDFAQSQIHYTFQRSGGFPNLETRYPFAMLPPQCSEVQSQCAVPVKACMLQPHLLFFDFFFLDLAPGPFLARFLESPSKSSPILFRLPDRPSRTGFPASFLTYNTPPRNVPSDALRPRSPSLRFSCLAARRLAAPLPLTRTMPLATSCSPQQTKYQFAERQNMGGARPDSDNQKLTGTNP